MGLGFRVRLQLLSGLSEAFVVASFVLCTSTACYLISTPVAMSTFSHGIMVTISCIILTDRHNGTAIGYPRGNHGTDHGDAACCFIMCFVLLFILSLAVVHGCFSRALRFFSTLSVDSCDIEVRCGCLVSIQLWFWVRIMQC